MNASRDQHSISELAGNRGLWEEYIDPDDNAPFDEYTQEEREAMIREIWGADFDNDGNPVEVEE